MSHSILKICIIWDCFSVICNPVHQAAKKAAMSAAEKATAAAEQEVNQGFKPAAIDQVRML
jgi:hypothetical protein